jgi:hypothetical protein
MSGFMWREGARCQSFFFIHNFRRCCCYQKLQRNRGFSTTPKTSHCHPSQNLFIPSPLTTQMVRTAPNYPFTSNALCQLVNPRIQTTSAERRGISLFLPTSLTFPPNVKLNTTILLPLQDLQLVDHHLVPKTLIYGMSVQIHSVPQSKSSLRG